MDNTSPWVDRLNSICSSLGVDVVEGDAFLGRGAFGRVFKVTRQGQEFALKSWRTALLDVFIERWMPGRKPSTRT